MRHALVVLLAVAGMLPGSILPVVVSAAHGQLGFTIAQAAALGSVATFSTAIGAFVIALLGVPARWAWSIPFVLGGAAMIDPEDGGAIWLSFVAKLGLAAGPLLDTLVIWKDEFARAILLSCVLGLGGALLFLRLERPFPFRTR